MNPKDLHQFALAVFFLFAALGPLTLLMDDSIIQASWNRLLFMTVLSGALSWGIVMTISSPMKLITIVLAYVAIIISTSLTDPEWLRPDVPMMIIEPGIPTVLTEGILADIELKRTYFGITAFVCIGVGYGLFARAITNENRRRAEMEAEVKLAQTIHESLLPKSSVTTEWCDIAGASVPASHIGGDFYDIIPIDQNRILVVIADASGHGTGAGILSAMTKSAITQELLHSYDPSLLLERVNSVIHRVTKKNMFVTCAVALFNREKASVSMITAGHPPILHVRGEEKEITEHRLHNLALGIRPDTKFISTTVPFNKGDLFCFITDGLTETTDGKNEQFGMNNIFAFLQQSPRTASDMFSKSLIDTVHLYSGGNQLNDDITTLVVRIL